ELQAALKGAGGSMLVVRGTALAPQAAVKSQPPISVSTSNAKLRDTTFSTGVGERVEADPAPKKGKGKAVAVFLVAAGLAGAGVFIFRDGEKVGLQHELAAVIPAATAPKVAAPPVAPVAPPAPVAP